MYIDKLPEDAVKIKNSYDYIDRRGNVYGIESRDIFGKSSNKGKPFIKTQRTIQGYKYCGIKYKDGSSTKNIQKRVHRLVAEAFLDKQDKNDNIVMHKNNNKKDNRVENLKWGTISENTKQAVDDGLLINDKGFDDSQSIPCKCYSTLTNELLGIYGSLHEASNDTGIKMATIRFQIQNRTNEIRKKRYFVGIDDKPIEHYIVCKYDYNTDVELERFPTAGKASKITGISEKSINAQINLNKKPSWTKSDYYFKKKLIK